MKDIFYQYSIVSRCLAFIFCFLIGCNPTVDNLPMIPDPDLVFDVEFGNNIINKVGNTQPEYRQLSLFSGYPSSIQSTENEFTPTWNHSGHFQKATYFNGRSFLRFDLTSNELLRSLRFNEFSVAFWVRSSGLTSKFSRSSFLAIGDENYSESQFGISMFDIRSNYMSANIWGPELISYWGNFHSVDFSRLYDVFVHICLTVDVDSWDVYLNGKLVEQYSRVMPPNVLINSNSGNVIFTIGEGFNGAMSDLKVFKRALGKEEIMRIYSE